MDLLNSINFSNFSLQSIGDNVTSFSSAFTVFESVQQQLEIFPFSENVFSDKTVEEFTFKNNELSITEAVFQEIIYCSEENMDSQIVDAFNQWKNSFVDFDRLYCLERQEEIKEVAKEFANAIRYNPEDVKGILSYESDKMNKIIASILLSTKDPVLQNFVISNAKGFGLAPDSEKDDFCDWNYSIAIIAQSNHLSSRLALEYASWNPVEAMDGFSAIEELRPELWTKDQWTEVAASLKSHVVLLELLSYLPSHLKNRFELALSEAIQNGKRLEEKSGSIYQAIQAKKDTESDGYLYTFSPYQNLLSGDRRKYFNIYKMAAIQNKIYPALEYPIGNGVSSTSLSWAESLGVISDFANDPNEKYSVHSKYPSKYYSSYQIPDLTALSTRWENYRKQHSEVLFPLKFANSDSIISDQDFVEAYLDGKMPLSSQEFVHDWTAHVLPTISFIVEDSAAYASFRGRIDGIVQSNYNLLIDSRETLAPQSYDQMMNILGFLIDITTNLDKETALNTYTINGIQDFESALNTFQNSEDFFIKYRSKRFGDEAMSADQLLQEWQKLRDCLQTEV